MWPSRAITFIDNHDTGSTLNHWPFPNNHLQEGYAYIITHPGTPCVFLDHLYQEKDGLRKVRGGGWDVFGVEWAGGVVGGEGEEG
jgi:alpha-amylase